MKPPAIVVKKLVDSHNDYGSFGHAYYDGIVSYAVYRGHRGKRLDAIC